jgi:hypothetical protein
MWRKWGADLQKYEGTRLFYPGYDKNGLFIYNVEFDTRKGHHVEAMAIAPFYLDKEGQIRWQARKIKTREGWKQTFDRVLIPMNLVRAVTEELCKKLPEKPAEEIAPQDDEMDGLINSVLRRPK